MFKNNLCRAGLLASLVSIGAAGAQNLQPIDPLQRPQTGAGSASFSVSAGYAPDLQQTLEGLTSSVAGGLGITATYNVTDRFAVTASTGIGGARTRTLNGEMVAAASDVNWNGLDVGAQYTFGGRYAPAVGLDVALPLAGGGWAVTGSTSASLLRDPVILDGTLAATWRSEGAPSLSAGLGVGFVVNEAVTLRADAIQSLTFGTLTVPSTTLGLGGAYKIDEQNSLQARTTLNVTGGRTTSGLSVSYLYRP
ncbi:outer membrane beta-barrel protein [Deinococcus sp. NW-56]|uniref:outer membrane beta-barrel protein n=1 Tax=Deinococcus sp. NW-56 TaxID=2080419 RepID=UPI000CF36E3A|nr:outer membrane beta-barrel protein [Deinococcus sp. NW-56]